MTREQLITLINNYIFPNGEQLITAAQLREVLLEIANAFAMEGETSGNLDTVLAAGSVVSVGREITNANGGKFILNQQEQITEEFMANLIGLESSDADGGYRTGLLATHQAMLLGSVRSDDNSVTSGELSINRLKSVVTSENSLSLASLNSTSKEAESTALSNVGTMYSLEKIPINNELTFPGGITSIVDSQLGKTSSLLTDLGFSLFFENTSGSGSINNGTFMFTTSGQSYRLNAEFKGEQINVYSDLTASTVSSGVYVTNTSGEVRSMSSQIDQQEQSWINQNGVIARIDGSGWKLSMEKKVSLSFSGANPTAGIAVLSNGLANVVTAAVTEQSVITLTVQDKGNYTGNIRVISKNIGQDFTIGTGIDSDNCEVFWQIIDLNI